jgi:2-polyprenyl-6-methoxyphenol hydroxylase-like FAD-dependent oxidoreductase
MLDVITHHFQSLGKFQITFSSKLDAVDLGGKTCRFSSGVSEKYDLLVGTDGVQSVLREAFVQQAQSVDATPEEKAFVAEEVLISMHREVHLQITHLYNCMLRFRIPPLRY